MCLATLFKIATISFWECQLRSEMKCIRTVFFYLYAFYPHVLWLIWIFNVNCIHFGFRPFSSSFFCSFFRTNAKCVSEIKRRTKRTWFVWCCSHWKRFIFPFFLHRPYTRTHFLFDLWAVNITLIIGMYQTGMLGWMETYCNDFCYRRHFRLCWNSFLGQIHGHSYFRPVSGVFVPRSIIIVIVVVVAIQSKEKEQYDKQFDVRTMGKIIAHL